MRLATTWAHTAGANAYRNGFRRHAYPGYCTDPMLRAAWLRGWDDAREAERVAAFRRQIASLYRTRVVMRRRMVA